MAIPPHIFKPIQPRMINKLKENATALLTTSNRITDDSVRDANQVRQRTCEHGNTTYGTKLDQIITNTPPTRRIMIIPTDRVLNMVTTIIHATADEVRARLGNPHLRRTESIEKLKEEAQNLHTVAKNMKEVSRTEPLTDIQHGQFEVILNNINQAKRNFNSLLPPEHSAQTQPSENLTRRQRIIRIIRRIFQSRRDQ